MSSHHRQTREKEEKMQAIQRHNGAQDSAEDYKVCGTESKYYIHITPTVNKKHTENIITIQSIPY